MGSPKGPTANARMHLTKQTDIALRTLLFLAANPGEPQTIDVVSQRFNIARNHLTKVVARLANLGYIEATRGRQGGILLARAPELINIAGVVRDFEPGFELLECFAPETSTCPITGACALQGVLRDALQAFLSTLMDCNLAEALGNAASLRRRLG